LCFDFNKEKINQFFDSKNPNSFESIDQFIDKHKINPNKKSDNKGFELKADNREKIEIKNCGNLVTTNGNQDLTQELFVDNSIFINNEINLGLDKSQTNIDLSGFGFSCDKCEQKYLTKHLLEIHRLEHKKKLNCPSELCLFETYCEFDLKLHIHNHRNRRFKCFQNDCIESFYEKKELIEHINKIHGLPKEDLKNSFQKLDENRYILVINTESNSGLDKSLEIKNFLEEKFSAKPEFSCNDCKQKFLTKNLLSIHKCPKKKLSCSIKGCVFETYCEFDLNLHLLKGYHKNRRYKCDRIDCIESFGRRKQLNQHIKKNHNNCETNDNTNQSNEQIDEKNEQKKDSNEKKPFKCTVYTNQQMMDKIKENNYLTNINPKNDLILGKYAIKIFY
jgi:hypothetical protein